MVGAVLVRLFSLWGSVSATFQHTACPKNNGLGLLQKSPSLMKVQADHEVGIGEGEDFYPVDGGVNRACRGASPGDNKAEYFIVATGHDLESCKATCTSTNGCKGIEFHVSGRCELWTRPEGIAASISLTDYTCLWYGTKAKDFLPVDGGVDRFCRGATSTDNKEAYFSIMPGLDLDGCKQACRDNLQCVGVEHAGTRCEIWTRADGIETSVPGTGSSCWKKEFSHADGTGDRACRGAHAGDNKPTYFSVQSSVPTLDACKDHCRATPGCVGIEHINTRCEIWTRPEGIQASVPLDGYTCLKYHGPDGSETTTPAPTTPPPSPVSRTPASDAQFLIQATFGPTLASIEELGKTTYDSWVDRQMALPITSHREYYRKRVNPRPVRSASDLNSGSPLSRCSVGSRWVRHAILKTDVNRRIQVSRGKIKVDDLFRTDVDPAYVGNGLKAPQTCTDLAPKSWQDEGWTCASQRWRVERECTKDKEWIEDGYCQHTCFEVGLGYDGDDCSPGWANLDYEGYICHVRADEAGAFIKLSTSSGCSTDVTYQLNPSVWKSSPDSSITQTLSFDIFRPGVLLLRESPAQCNLATIVRSAAEGQSHFYMLEERLELVENTVENPSATGSSSGKCPTVSRSFLNEAGCKLLPGCLPLGQQKLLVPLTITNLAAFYSVGGRYVYAVTGLKTTKPPCGSMSRWKHLVCDPVCTPSDIDNSTAEKIRNALEEEADQGLSRDIEVSCSGVPAEAVVQVGSEFFQHVHGDENNVYDFTDWTLQHPGGASKIKQFTSKGYLLVFPSWHPMDRWDTGLATEVIRPGFVGKLGTTVQFHNLPQPLQTDALAAALGAVPEEQEFSEVCGSPGEVSNEPQRGHHLSFKHGAPDDWYFDSYYSITWGIDRLAKSAVWTTQSLHADDQLRQRAAWALSQIFVCSVHGAGYRERAESWLSYYDIFVRNAFGNFRDIMQQVTYNPIMGDYLTYKRNRAWDSVGRFPDENYAREIMQLFTIGLWKLNPDGTDMLDQDGNRIPTYSNDQIMNFARVFTGFDEQRDRGNVEYVDGRNRIDPMQMKADWHDKYPKPDLDGNYLGDGHPLCSDLPAGAFLMKGAKYHFVGHVHDEDEGVLNLSSSSALHQALCFEASGKCSYRLTVELAQTLTCTGAECTADTVKTVSVSGGLYEYMEPTCVNLFFFNGQATRRGGRSWGWTKTCRDPNALVAGIACCNGCKNSTTSWMRRKGYTCENAQTTWPSMFTDKCGPNGTDSWWQDAKFCQLACWEAGVGYEGDDCSYGLWHGERPCNYDYERVRFATAEKMCKARGLEVCNEKLENYGCQYNDEHVWTPEICSYEVIVHEDGLVSSNWTSKTKQNKIKVYWQDRLYQYPKVDNGQCPSGCVVADTACSCDMTVETRVAFTSTPMASEVTKLKIGAAPPSIACSSNCGGEVRTYFLKGQFDESTVFEHNGVFYKNLESVVKLGSYEFRNPPVFMPTNYAEPKHALAEVESLLDHLFTHPNTAPFISYRLIQRLASSNPSPGFVLDVANAFKTGRYNGKVYSGKYGDLGATFAAILLHPEARGQSTPSNGALREPLLKLMHLMRAMEYKDQAERIVMIQNLQDKIGQWPFNHPSVFNYYLPDFKPDNFPQGMVAPEFQIFTPPMAINFINGLASLIDYGLGECRRGFGFWSGNCSHGVLHVGEFECLQPTIDQMDLLLTGGRLHNKEFIKAAYQEADGADRYKVAQKAVILSPEFNILGSSLPLGPRPPPVPKPEQQPRDYKALVMVLLNGGADSYNMLVPVNCPLYDEYRTVRENIAMKVEDLHLIDANNQNCSQYGIHFALPTFKELYDSKELAFVANVGSLVESMDRTKWRSGSGENCVGLFSHSDQQRAAQTLTCHLASASSKGAGGRIADALAGGSSAMKTMSFSVAGSQPWPQGVETNAEIINNGQPIGIEKMEQLQVVIDNITSIRHGNIYGEEYNQRLSAALAFNEQLRKSLKNVELKTSFSTDNRGLTRQFKEVARLIASRAERKVERDLFFVQLGGFDTHSSVATNLRRRFEEVDHGFKRFVAELKAQGIFDSTVMVTHSDFARTLTPNSGQGSDHAWGGNYIVAGGAVQGGNIFNSFPKSFLPGAEQDAGRGRLIPKHPWENFMRPVAEWVGLDASQLSEVFPNIGNFDSSHFIDKASLFK